MKYPYSGVILAGGLSTRFSGTNKAFIRVCGIRILDRIYDIFKDLFEEVILVTNDPLLYLEWDMSIFTDIFPVRSSLTGIHSGLFCSTKPYSFFTACDAPFIKKEVIEALIERIDPRFDVVIPETSAGLEPLCAIYSKRCLNIIAERLVRQEFKIRQFFKSIRMNKIPESVLREKDPELISFFNINTAEELAKAEKMLLQ